MFIYLPLAVCLLKMRRSNASSPAKGDVLASLKGACKPQLCQVPSWPSPFNAKPQGFDNGFWGGWCWIELECNILR